MFFERIFHAISYSIVGFGIVFLTLFVLVCVVAFIKWIDDRWEEREEKEREAALNKTQNIDHTTLVLISAAVATYFEGRARITKVRVLPSHPNRGGSWAFQARAVLQGSHFLKK